MATTSLPHKQGLFDPRYERDACGFGFVANIKNRKSHSIVRQGLKILVNLDHRGAVGADPLAGDGSGILMQIPDVLLRAECAGLGVTLPPEGKYGVGMVFLPRNAETGEVCVKTFQRICSEEGLKVLGWRDVPVDNSCLGESVKPTEPVIRQVFIIPRGNDRDFDVDAVERKLMVVRKRIHRNIRNRAMKDVKAFYISSLSTRTIVYKGIILAPNLDSYFKDLCDERTQSALAMVHQRFSTNTFPSWELAHPFRYLCHNGEINTLRGNINWMAARRHNMKSEVLGDDLKKLWPLILDGKSDSATFDNALELLIAAGYSLCHAMALMIPEAWHDNPLMKPKRRAFYEYNAALMEPWDGPAAMAFTDGRQIGATLDRNGLRPARYIVTNDDLVIAASEVGVLDIPEENIVKKWRLQPGKMFLADLEQGRIIDDEELKRNLASAQPYQRWLNQTQIKVEALPTEVAAMPPDSDTLMNLQQAFGYTQEDLKFFLGPMALNSQDPISSMGRDIPPAVLSKRPKLLYDYFSQCFAQVTNPPIDPIREELVMSLVSLIGPRPNLLDLNTGGAHKRLEVTQPILSNIDLEKIRHIHEKVDNAFHAFTLDICYPAALGAGGMKKALDRLCRQAQEEVLKGDNILVLSDRAVDADNVAIPALLACAAVHHHLIREGLRTEVGLVVETGEARQVHDFCLLAGYGAEAINPYLAFETISSMLPELNKDLKDKLTEAAAHKNYIKAIDKGILKVMSKMGISTYQSYCGAQIFDAVGLSTEFIDKYFTWTSTAIEGVGLKEIAAETVRRHADAYGGKADLRNALDPGGELAVRLRGEEHIWTSESISKLQHACYSGDFEAFREFSKVINDRSKRLMNLRGLFEFNFGKNAIPLDEVEPIESIFKRFSTGAMSFGSISHEAHTTTAIAMNRIGGKSNTGEGGEEPERYTPQPNGDSTRSAIKQVASGRFGVTAEYLVNADEIQIKMAQGAKPGEGGQLPGHKVNKTIARVRHSTPGVGLISPPPHHDIYSIEDLAQLIHDLKNVNPKARISVKLVSEKGVGTIASGVAKAHADHVLISGCEGGTGASPITSVMHAGSPWELGLSETHQTLLLHRLRGRIAVQTDGGVRTGRDVVIAALLGADELGFATIALIAEGCLMMRKCHLNTCPVGIATQDRELRSRFTGKPEHVVNYFTFVARETRELMAELGFRTFNEMIGRTDKLRVNRAVDHWKASGLDLTPLLYRPKTAKGVAVYNSETQDHALEKALDHKLIKLSKSAIENKEPVKIELPVRNINRTVGAMLSGRVALRHGHKGLPEDTIYIKSKGTGGQSFGAFLAHGITIELEGDANDYVGKGLSGGRIIIYPPKKSSFKAEENILIGNTVLYGAISGECYFHGVAGERFGVRNSGAVAVVEGVGDHGCEYMTGGCVVVLGETGRNFAAGMSGGIAYVYDKNKDFDIRCNMSMVRLEPIVRNRNNNVNMADKETFNDMLRHDEARLKWLIERHLRYTGSPRAREIMENWNRHLPMFHKVMPVDFLNALQKPQLRDARHSKRTGQSPQEG
ncbi:MAG: glutamate synthase subunit alpha [Rhodospirillales bacterium RIFCSPLOWO2_12_FULL_58_28]|nr:MAG: glutamate synthase subunit alpha [Rhodospirillales bacterium RIFCSPLOWO2_02_FULL_58_16]OHC79173.1 MAG: glutamate synthase subunit alpha [Rhodospirillales bacterium RIFCSPLOWO2_12_FULL_58_28]